MQLLATEVDLFYTAWMPLLRFVNERKRVLPTLDLTGDPEGAAKVRDALWAEPSLLDTFVRENPAKLSAEALALASSWRHRVAGTFILYKPLKKHMVVLKDGEPAKAYGVLGLRTPLDEMVPWLPCMVKGVMLPFGDRIIFDGLLTTYNLHLGPGLRAGFAATYRAAKDAIITRLGPTSVVELIVTAGGEATASTLVTKEPPTTKRAAAASASAKKTAANEALTEPGRCEGCGEVFSKRAISRHVGACEGFTKSSSAKPKPRLRFVVDSPGAPEYWLVVDVGMATPLSQLDRFLRDIWLECCGHLSAFRIGGVSYTSDPDSMGGFTERGMNTKLSSLADVATWSYEYDFGSTTALRIRPVGLGMGPEKGVRLLARNLAPERRCEGCGAPAKHVCAQCVWDGAGWVCDACAPKHACGEDGLLPVVNSPRVGVCGYEG